MVVYDYYVENHNFEKILFFYYFMTYDHLYLCFFIQLSKFILGYFILPITI
jgi:hypothetical protein